MTTSQVWLCSKCGITPGHLLHPKLNNDGAYFTSRATEIGTWPIRQGVSKNGYNVNEVHVPKMLEDCVQFDYVVYTNKDEIKIVNKVTSIEYVNPNSTRIQFEIDYWHTYSSWINWGETYSFVARTHVKDYNNVSDYLLAEPVSPPTQTVRLTQSFPQWDNWHGPQDTSSGRAYWRYLVYASVDENGNGNSPAIKLRQMEGGMYYGGIEPFNVGQEDALTAKLKQYVNQQQWFQTSVSPMIANTQKVVLVPWPCTNESVNAVTDIGETVLSLPNAKFLKIFAPQFCKLRLVASSNGAFLDFDSTYAMFSNKTTVTFKINFFIVGGQTPMGGAQLMVHRGEDRDQPDMIASNSLRVCQEPYPEVPFNMYLPSKMSIGNEISGTLSAIGNVVDAGIGLSTASRTAEIPILNIETTSRAYTSATRAAINSAKLFDGMAHGVGSETYTKVSGANGLLAWALAAYGWEVIATVPTKEGVDILNGFFNSFGYAVEKRLKIDLAIRGNFTYIQTRGYPTFSGDAPQIALDHIAGLLERGATVWSVNPGSTEDCG